MKFLLSIRNLFPLGTEQTVQLVPVPVPVLTLPERTSQASNELVFQATDIPPLGFRSYYISKTAAVNSRLNSKGPRDLTIGNEVRWK